VPLSVATATATPLLAITKLAPRVSATVPSSLSMRRTRSPLFW